MIQTIVILVLIAIIAALFAVVLYAHRKQQDALAILIAASTALLAWVKVFQSRDGDDGNDGKGTQ